MSKSKDWLILTSEPTDRDPTVAWVVHTQLGNFLADEALEEARHIKHVLNLPVLLVQVATQNLV